MPLPAVVGTVVGGLVTWWQKRSESKDRINEAKTEAQIERLKNTSDQSGWKDEYLVVLWSLPAIMAFIPYFQPYVREGFIILKTETPEWYMIGWLGITGAVFGLKRLIEYRQNGNKR
jgi:hypothetical protein